MNQIHGEAATYKYTGTLKRGWVTVTFHGTYASTLPCEHLATAAQH